MTTETHAVPEKLAELQEGFEVWRVPLLQLKEQDRNARVQSSGTFKALTRNIKNRGALESLPFVTRQGEDFWIISGHHRVRAAIAAELAAIPVLVDVRPMTRSEIVAKQLAHNSLNGQDDPAMILQLLGEIENVDAMIEAAIDREEIEKLVKANVSVPDVKVDFQWKTVYLTFLPTQLEDFTELVNLVGESDMVGVASKEIYDDFVGTMKRLAKTENIRSVGAVLCRMVELTKQYLETQEPAEAPAAGEGEGTAEGVSTG
jgi:hypothetical protein